jgi:hypothetical protein
MLLAQRLEQPADVDGAADGHHDGQGSEQAETADQHDLP